MVSVPEQPAELVVVSVPRAPQRVLVPLTATLLTACSPAKLDVGPPPSMAFEQVDSMVVDTHPQAGAAADLDHDGHVEIVVPLSPASAVLILDVTLRGALSVATEISLEEWPEQAVAADFNGDGLQDIVVTLAHSFESIVYLATAPDTYEPASALRHTRSDRHQVMTGDLDGDGDVDIITATEFSQWAIDVWTNTGGAEFSGPLAQSEVAEGCRAPILADVDLDGWGDIVCGTNAERWVSTLRGTGSTMFAPSEQVQTGLFVTDLAIGDFDGTGPGQLALAGATEIPYGEYELWLARWEGDSLAMSYADGFPAHTLAAGDLDADGDDDLIASAYDGPVVVLESLGGGQWAQPIELVPHVGTFAQPMIIDIDGRPPLDIVLLDNLGGRVMTFLGEAL